MINAKKIAHLTSLGWLVGYNIQSFEYVAKRGPFTLIEKNFNTIYLNCLRA